MDSGNGHTSDEKKHWVRITRACNNRCMFCLDRDMLDGAITPMDEVVADLRRGIDRGAKRAIISGGEPTIHPDYIKIISAASEMGYTWVQSITNGRMFYYRDFVEKAVNAGLKEITFSMHGHTPELFEKLTGAPGSYKQALTGLNNALSTPGLVVSVDVVVTGLNAPFLADIIQFYRKLGVWEYDLLYPVPFGNAWNNRSEILEGLEDAASAIREVLPLADSHGLTIWTNRMPAPLLEGFESFIQPPAKIHDEVYGRREMFLDFLERDVPLPCEGERCGFCAMADFCAMLRSEKDAVAENRQREYEVTEETAGQLDSIDPSLVSGLALDPPGLVEHDSVRRILSAGNARVTYIYREIPDGFISGAYETEEIEISLNRNTAPKLLAHGLPESGGVPLRIALHNYASLDECLGEAVSARIFFKNFRLPPGEAGDIVRNVPPCVTKAAGFFPIGRIPLGMHTPGEVWNLEAITEYFITRGRYHRSLRCAGCRHLEECPGLHINFIRAFGFSEIIGPVL